MAVTMRLDLYCIPMREVVGMKTIIIKASSKAPVLFAALFLCALFSFAKPVEVKANTYSTDVSTSQLETDEIVVISGDITITIDCNKEINSLIQEGSHSIRVIEDGNYTLTINNGIAFQSNTLIMEGGKIKVNNSSTTFQNLQISGGTIEASCDRDSGIFIYSSLTMTGGNVKATGSLCGISAENITISGGSIDVTGSTVGLYASSNTGTISISGDNTIVKAKTTSNSNAGLKANNGITIGDSLAVFTPAGGGISSDGKYIATTAGGTVMATEVEIKRGHSITVTNDGHGTGRADPPAASEDATINLYATPNPGYEFDGWTTESDISITDDTNPNYAYFAMIDFDVTVKANFKPKPGPKPEPKKDDDNDHTWNGPTLKLKKDEDKIEEEHNSKPAVVNPDTVEGFFAVNGQILPGVAMGKMKQGPAAQAVFNANRPAGWKEAFTFNIAINGKVDYTLKNGKLIIFIPKEYQKEGRTFALMALDKNGKAWTFADIDTNPSTLTANINVEGYAFALIYKD